MKKEAPGGVSFRFAVGTNGAAAAHVRYITREPATEGNYDRIYLHNLPGARRDGDGFRETRKGLIEYARTKEKYELEKRCQGRVRAGQERVKPRTHYRANCSFEGEVEPQKALSMVREFLTENFPLARAVAAVHTDTSHTHVHLTIFARQTNNRKVQLSDREFRQLDERWAAIYAREFGAEKYAQYLAKKAEMAEANRVYFASLKEIEDRPGLSASDRENLRSQFKESYRWPERSDYRQTRERIRERETRNHDQSGAGRDQRETQSRDHQTQARERGEGRAGTAAERAAGAAERALRGLERATERSREISERGERLYSRERERDRGR